MKKVLIGAAAAVTLVLLGVGILAYSAMHRPFKGYDNDVLLVIPHGSGTRDIAHQLTDSGVLESEWPFLLTRGLRRSATLQAGEYAFTSAESPWDVFSRLEQGDIYTFDITIPEGSNIWDIARILEQQGLFTEADFLTAAADPTPIKDLAPDAESLEGYLFPSTYRISHATTAKDLVQMMVEEFRRQWVALEPASQDGARLSPHQAVTLASLVEKETGLATERDLVAGVFSNRLEMGMPLACDPTVIYAARLAGNWRGTIYRSDLDREHPYNTYLNAGLPPGPIANPGREALEAALHPADTKYLFFVANPAGPGHVFSATGAEHSRAVQAYRAAQP